MTTMSSNLDPDFEILEDTDHFQQKSHSHRIEANRNHSIHGMVGLDNIRRQLQLDIASLQPLSSDSHFFDNALPSNDKCTHSGKVFSIGIMKVSIDSWYALNIDYSNAVHPNGSSQKDRYHLDERSISRSRL